MDKTEAIELLIRVNNDVNLLNDEDYAEICKLFPTTPKKTETGEIKQKPERPRAWNALQSLLFKRYDEGRVDSIDDLTDWATLSNSEQNVPDTLPDIVDPRLLPELIAETWNAILEQSNQKKNLLISDIFDQETTITKAGKKVVQTSYENSPKDGIVLVKTIMYPSEHSPVYNRKILFKYYISKITRYEDPTDPLGIFYSITFENAERRSRPLEYHETRLEYIIADITKNRPGVSDPILIRPAIMSLVNQFENSDLVKRESRIPATGFFLNSKNEIIYNISPGFKPSLPDTVDPFALKRAIDALSRVILFYSRQSAIEDVNQTNAQHVLNYLYYYIQAPTGLVRKQSGLENNYLFVYGLPHVGKTWFAKWGSAIWGLTNEQGIVGAASLTEPQLAGHFNKTTFPLCLDEIRNALKNPRVCESLKSGSTGVLIKNRINAKENFRVDQFHAYASLILTANHVPELYVGMEDRLLTIEFTREHKHEENDKITEFERLLYSVRTDMAHLGAAIRDFILRDQSTVLRLLTNNDQIKFGFELLRLVLQRHGITPPSWLILTEVNKEIIETNPVDILFEFLKDSYMEQLRRHVWKDVGMPVAWDDRLEQILEQNILPNHTINISQNYLVITASISVEIARKMNYELPGGARGLVAMIPGSKYQPYKGKKVLMIPRRAFIDAVTPLKEHQAELGLEKAIA